MFLGFCEMHVFCNSICLRGFHEFPDFCLMGFKEFPDFLCFSRVLSGSAYHIFANAGAEGIRRRNRAVFNSNLLR